MSRSMGGVSVRREARRDRTIQPHEHDMYRMPRKPDEPSYCQDCGAVFERGRWQWADHHRIDAVRLRCPACSRIRDRAPMGVVTLRGEFLKERRDEIMNLVRHEADRVTAAHPLARLMSVAEAGGDVQIATTDLHLARRIGAALHAAYAGDLQIQYPKGGDFVRVTWQR